MEILSDDEKKAIKQALEDAKVIRAEIARAQRAGIPVTELVQRLNEVEQQLKQIERVYLTQTRR